MDIYRWADKQGGVHEYRFEDGVCVGFFSNNVEHHQEQGYKGRELTPHWAENLKVAGFIKSD